MAIYGVIALVLFVTLFALVLVYTFRRKNQRKFERAARLPLRDGMDPEDSR